MIARVVAWYAKRIVNVNINIVLAGLLALGPVVLVAKGAEWMFESGHVHSYKLQTHHHLVISGATFFSDIIIDVAIYFVLHWLANHTPKLILIRKGQLDAVADAAAENVPFFRDAVKVQIQRAVLSPLLYLLWLGTQFVMMNKFDVDVGWATAIGFCIAMGVVRTLHTGWMLWEERKRRAVAGGMVCGKCGHDLRDVPAESTGVCPECGKQFLRAGPIKPATVPAAPSENGRVQSLSEKGVKSVSRS